MSNHTSHGTEKSYIVGFGLSLLFTVIPYYMVVDKLITGTLLLVTILAIAVIQMIIQIVFFLHLGRERKPRWQFYFLIGTVVGILTVVGGSIFIMQHLHHNMNPSETIQKLTQDEGISQVEGKQTGACQTVRKEYTVTIQNGVASPARVDAHACDAIIFTSQDNVKRNITFGTYPQDVPYAGQENLAISPDHSQMLILSQTGSYQFHDQLDPAVSGTFTVVQ